MWQALQTLLSVVHSTSTARLEQAWSRVKVMLVTALEVGALLKLCHFVQILTHHFHHLELVVNPSVVALICDLGQFFWFIIDLRSKWALLHFFLILLDLLLPQILLFLLLWTHQAVNDICLFLVFSLLHNFLRVFVDLGLVSLLLTLVFFLKRNLISFKAKDGWFFDLTKRLVQVRSGRTEILFRQSFAHWLHLNE